MKDLFVIQLSKAYTIIHTYICTHTYTLSHMRRHTINVCMYICKCTCSYAKKNKNGTLGMTQNSSIGRYLWQHSCNSKVRGTNKIKMRSYSKFMLTTHTHTHTVQNVIALKCIYFLVLTAIYAHIFGSCVLLQRIVVCIRYCKVCMYLYAITHVQRYI